MKRILDLVTRFLRKNTFERHASWGYGLPLMKIIGSTRKKQSSVKKNFHLQDGKMPVQFTDAKNGPFKLSELHERTQKAAIRSCPGLAKLKTAIINEWRKV
jgi:hypothetical protein